MCSVYVVGALPVPKLDCGQHLAPLPAAAGLYQGTRRAAHEAWVDWREDEVRARLIRASSYAAFAQPPACSQLPLPAWAAVAVL